MFNKNNDLKDNNIDLNKLGYQGIDGFDLDDYGEEEDFKSELKFNGVKVIIKSNSNKEESKKHLNHDCEIVRNVGLDKIILEKFIPWLKGKDYLDRDNQKVLEGLKLYEVTYNYMKISAKYSPTGKDDYFGYFEFCFESGDDYTSDMLEAVSMEVYIYNDKIVKVNGYDI